MAVGDSKYEKEIEIDKCVKAVDSYEFNANF